MAKRLNITAVCGWAIPELWFSGLVEKSFPDSDVRVLYPTHPHDRDEAKDLIEEKPCDIYIGHSLGSLWLLFHKDLLIKGSAKIMLAPIIDFTDCDKGSKISSSKIKYLIRQIRNQADYAPYIMEFFNLCRIDIPTIFLKQIHCRETLLEGLEFLLKFSANGISLNDCICLVGDADALIDSEKLNNVIPQLHIVQGAEHGPEKLLRALIKFRLFKLPD